MQSITEPHIIVSEELDNDEEFQRMKDERRREIDQLSLELLSNTTQYRKMTKKTSSEERIRRQEDSSRFLKYKSRIAKLCNDLLENFDDPVEKDALAPPELQHCFAEFVQRAAQVFDWDDWAKKKAHAFDEDRVCATDADSMFAPPRHKADPFSMWGGIQIHKTA
jgi:uncharacterized protein (DUF885 family)